MAITKITSCGDFSITQMYCFFKKNFGCLEYNFLNVLSEICQKWNRKEKTQVESFEGNIEALLE